MNDGRDELNEWSVVARYRNHADAEEAVRRLHKAGIDPARISLIGRDFEVREDVQGFYRPADIAAEGARQGAWVGGLFGLFAGLAFFVFPVAGPLFVLGPLAGLLAGAVGGAGVGALLAGLMSLGIDRERALRYQSHLQAGEWLLVVHAAFEEVERAREILGGTGPQEVEQYRRPAESDT
jgi:hypothetical protein